ncbi:MAG: ABC transporter ATP-binding protein [Candidatus Doudnabacteria bacterium]|nr:ABC transporter ATP-binding protein [Candidatus Doudnabacteria bacterium]
MSQIIEVKKVSKSYLDGKRKTGALDDVSFSLPAGESMAIIGPSGSGKTTLLHLLGGLDKPSAGNVSVNGQELTGLSDKELSMFRNQTIGFVFQFFYLNEYLNVFHNIALPMWLAGKSGGAVDQRVNQLIERVGLIDRATHFPSQLSGGEMQRVAVARALANEPKLILADEPTGNLDRDNAENILQIFDEISDSGVSIVAITHDKYVADRFDHVVKLNKGRLQPEAKSKTT